MCEKCKYQRTIVQPEVKVIKVKSKQFVIVCAAAILSAKSSFVVNATRVKNCSVHLTMTIACSAHRKIFTPKNLP